MNNFKSTSFKVQQQKFEKQKKTFFHSRVGQINMIRPSNAIVLVMIHVSLAFKYR